MNWPYNDFFVNGYEIGCLGDYKFKFKCFNYKNSNVKAKEVAINKSIFFYYDNIELANSSSDSVDEYFFEGVNKQILMVYFNDKYGFEFGLLDHYGPKLNVYDEVRVRTSCDMTKSEAVR